MNLDPSTRDKLRIVLNSYRMLGLVSTLKDMLVYLLEESHSNRFDEQYGVSTSGYVEPESSGIVDEEARSYAPLRPPTSATHILETAPPV